MCEQLDQNFIIHKSYCLQIRSPIYRTSYTNFQVFIWWLGFCSQALWVTSNGIACNGMPSTYYIGKWGGVSNILECIIKIQTHMARENANKQTEKEAEKQKEVKSGTWIWLSTLHKEIYPKLLCCKKHKFGFS